jgi:hypothetical protein
MGDGGETFRKTGAKVSKKIDEIKNDVVDVIETLKGEDSDEPSEPETTTTTVTTTTTIEHKGD